MSNTPSLPLPQQDYVLGVHDTEIARLGLQHRAWRARALALWRKAGLRAGTRVLDFGCGPGYATLDLAEIVGPTGAVLAVDRSSAFLARLGTEAKARALTQISTREADLMVADLDLPTGFGQVDFAWARWIFAFTPELDRALDNFAAALAPGGIAAITEYITYGTWGFLPAEPVIADFCASVMHSWRARGGEPDVAGRVIAGLIARGFEVQLIEPALDIITRDDPLWDWPDSFIRSNLPRLVELGDLSQAAATKVLDAWDAASTRPQTRMITPLTAQILARKPA